MCGLVVLDSNGLLLLLLELGMVLNGYYKDSSILLPEYLVLLRLSSEQELLLREDDEALLLLWYSMVMLLGTVLSLYEVLGRLPILLEL